MELNWDYASNRDQYAYFSATGAADPATITKSLGIDPDRVYAIGDSYKSHQGHELKRRQSHWRLNSGLDADVPLNDHIHAILGRLMLRRDEVLKLQESFNCQIVCVSFTGNFSFETTLHMQRSMAALGLTFWFDIYPDLNPHEEITELRSQLADAMRTKQ